MVSSVCTTTVTGACGVGVLYDFNAGESYYRQPVNDFINPGGCNWLCAGFIEGDSTSDKVLKELIEAGYKEVFRTPVRVNKNSGHKFYFVVFDGGEDCAYGFDAEEEGGEEDDF